MKTCSPLQSFSNGIENDHSTKTVPVERNRNIGNTWQFSLYPWHLPNDVSGSAVVNATVRWLWNRGRIEQTALQQGITLPEAEAQLYANVPTGRITHPEEIAALSLFLSSPHAGAITGESIHIDGGAFRGISY